MRRQRGLVLPGGLDGRICVVRSRLESTPCGSSCSREVKESRQKSKPSSSSLHPQRCTRGGPTASRRRQHWGSCGASRAPAPGRGGQSRAARRGRGHGGPWPHRRGRVGLSRRGRARPRGGVERAGHIPMRQARLARAGSSWRR